MTQLAAAGVREITLLGQNVNSWGRDLAPDIRTEFGELLRACDAVDGIERIRFTSPHPKDFREPVVAAMAECDAVCEHIHLPLQSGSTRILKAMRRTYSRERYLALAERLREAIPDLALGTDIIVGFPGETEADFEETLAVVEEVRYDSAFTFIYSPRRGTDAATMADQVPEAVKHERLERLVEVVQRIAAERNAERVGRVEQVLVEGQSRTDETLLRGRTRRNTTVCSPGPAQPGDLVDVVDRGIHLDDAARLASPPPFPPDQSHAMVAVIAVFGPTASGKTAVAEAVADRLGSEVVSCDAMQVYRGPADPDQPAEPADRARRDPRPRRGDVGRRVRHARPCGDRRARRTHRHRGRQRRNGALPPRSARRPRRAAAARRGSAGAHRAPRSSAIRLAAHERLAAPRSARGRGGPRERPAAPRARARARRDAGASLVPDDDRLWASTTRHPTLIVGLEVPADELERRIVARTEAMFEQGVVAEVQAALARGRVAHGSEDARPRRDRDAARGRGARAHRHPHPSLRRLPAEVDAPDPGPRPVDGTGRGRDRGRRLWSCLSRGVRQPRSFDQPTPGPDEYSPRNPWPMICVVDSGLAEVALPLEPVRASDRQPPLTWLVSSTVGSTVPFQSLRPRWRTAGEDAAGTRRPPYDRACRARCPRSASVPAGMLRAPRRCRSASWRLTRSPARAISKRGADHDRSRSADRRAVARRRGADEIGASALLERVTERREGAVEVRLAVVTMLPPFPSSG